MSPGFAGVTRTQLSALQGQITAMGAVQSFTFKGVGAAGRDIYEVKFQNGTLEFRIGLEPDGKVEGITMRAL